MIKVFWHQSTNFGDKLTPYFLDKLGIEYEYVDKGCDQEHYIICGSILSACNKNSIIWGAGLAQDYNMEPPLEICAVRGRETRSMLQFQGIPCPEIYGDISELLPLIYRPKVDLKRPIGFVPHFIEYTGEGCDLQGDIERTIDYIASSEKIVTSSLHAFLTARAYGVEAEWYESDRVIGQRTKRYDSMSYLPDTKKLINACPIQDIKNKL